MTRGIMTRAELAEHKVRSYGRNYAESDDGYSDMEAEEKRGWHVHASWGRDGWDLGEWPYVSVFLREAKQPKLAVEGDYQLMQVVEGDRTTWAFSTPEDRDAAIDYLFLWYAAGKRWAPLTKEQREQLDDGTLTVEDKWRGPYRSER